jgi:predicted CoA-binding protein
MDLKEILKTVQTVLVIDWPSKEVPERLALAGFHVVVRGGPGPQDYSVYEVENGEVVRRPLGHALERADLIYAYRPLNELPGIVATAKSLGATIIWTQSGLSAPGVKDLQGCWVADAELQCARDLVQSVGLHYVTESYIVDVIPTHSIR